MRLSRIAVVAAVVAVAVLSFAAPASAHVTVNPRTAAQGGFAALTFRVPNEKADASTVGLEVLMPEDAPVASVSLKPVPGWTTQVERRTLDSPITVHGAQITEVVGKITWTAEPGAAIAPGQFQEFVISAGPLPEVDQMIFKALQHYSDGETVHWIDEPQEGVDLEHPAPVLRLTPAGGGGNGEAAAGVSESGDGDGGGGAALGLGIAGVVLGLAGLALGLLAYRRTMPSR